MKVEIDQAGDRKAALRVDLLIRIIGGAVGNGPDIGAGPIIKGHAPKKRPLRLDLPNRKRSVVPKYARVFDS